jgi:hypothetical protein
LLPEGSLGGGAGAALHRKVKQQVAGGEVSWWKWLRRGKDMHLAAARVQRSVHPLESQFKKPVSNFQIVCQSSKPHAFMSVRVSNAFIVGRHTGRSTLSGDEGQSIRMG